MADTLDHDQLKTLLLLAAVDRSGSYAAAARELGTTRARVSRLIAQAEARLQVRLCYRTTRQVVLTDAAHQLVGAINYHLDSIQAAVSALTETDNQLRGPVRLSVSNTFGKMFVTPVLTEFIKQHPLVTLEYRMSDKVESLVGQAIDIAIRLGPLPDSDIIAKPLGCVRSMVVGQREFLANYGTFPVAQLADLDTIPCIGFKPVSVVETRPWYLEIHNEQASYKVRNPVVSVNSIDAVVDLVKAGVGIAEVPDYLIVDEIKSGRVVELLSDYRGIGPEVHLCYSNRTLIPQRVQKLIECLTVSIRARLS